MENKKKKKKKKFLFQIGNFLSGIGKKTYFLALGMGPNFGPKIGWSRALETVIETVLFSTHNVFKKSNFHLRLHTLLSAGLNILLTVNVLKLWKLLFLLSNRMMVMRDGIHKFRKLKANMENPDSEEAVWFGSACLSRAYAYFRRQLFFTHSDQGLF